MRVAALVPNLPGVAPGQRVRIESWTGYLESRGWTVDLYPFESVELHEVLYAPGQAAAKARELASCYRRQLQRVLTMPPCDVVFVYREAALVGPAVLERLAARMRAPLLYDLDDPTFVPYRSPTNGWASVLKFPRKTNALFRRASHVITINRLIGDYAARYNPAVTVVPNFVDVERYTPAPSAPPGPVRLVWIGSHSTAPNLVEIGPALARLQADRDVVVCAVGAGAVTVPGVRVESRQWSAGTEVADLQSSHIGLVPLNDAPWNRWKSFYKVVQYMAVGLPVVARRMGSNDEVIEDGVNGFLVETQEDWYERLRLLVDDADLRARMGRAARRTAVDHFSADVHLPRVAAVFEDLLVRAPG